MIQTQVQNKYRYTARLAFYCTVESTPSLNDWCGLLASNVILPINKILTIKKYMTWYNWRNTGEPESFLKN